MPNPYTADELAAIRRESDTLLARLAADLGPRHERHVVKSERLFRWSWSVIDAADLVDGKPRVIAQGQSWSNRLAWWRVERAYAAELDRLDQERLEAQAAEIRERAS